MNSLNSVKKQLWKGDYCRGKTLLFKTEKLLDFEIVNAQVEQLVVNALENNDITVINTINPHSYIESKKDAYFRDSLKMSDFLIPDGSGICLAIRLINGVNLKKIAGFDLFIAVMTELNLRNGSVYFLGSSDYVLNKIQNNIKNDFPMVSVKTLSPPYATKFSEIEITTFVNDINNFCPDVVFIGLTAPKQEKLIHAIKKQINTKLISGIGAVFDFYAGTVRRPSPLWIKLHLEWLIRLLGEPKRLWQRNFISTPLFLLDVLRARLVKSTNK